MRKSEYLNGNGPKRTADDRTLNDMDGKRWSLSTLFTSRYLHALVCAIRKKRIKAPSPQCGGTSGAPLFILGDRLVNSAFIQPSNWPVLLFHGMLVTWSMLLLLGQRSSLKQQKKGRRREGRSEETESQRWKRGRRIEQSGGTSPSLSPRGVEEGPRPGEIWLPEGQLVKDCDAGFPANNK